MGIILSKYFYICKGFKNILCNVLVYYSQPCNRKLQIATNVDVRVAEIQRLNVVNLVIPTDTIFYIGSILEFILAKVPANNFVIKDYKLILKFSITLFLLCYKPLLMLVFLRWQLVMLKGEWRLVKTLLLWNLKAD